MTDDETISAFLDAHTLPDAAFSDGAPRVWFQYLDGKQAVFSLADGETEDDAELADLADTAMKALVAAHPECASLTFRLEES